jgi:hypothetical protein
VNWLIDFCGSSALTELTSEKLITSPQNPSLLRKLTLYRPRLHRSRKTSQDNVSLSAMMLAKRASCHPVLRVHAKLILPSNWTASHDSSSISIKGSPSIGSQSLHVGRNDLPCRRKRDISSF